MNAPLALELRDASTGITAAHAGDVTEDHPTGMRGNERERVWPKARIRGQSAVRGWTAGSTMPAMRIAAVVVLAAALGGAAQESSPQQIVYARVSPNPGGLGLFIASADGSDERPLLSTPNLDYD